MNLWEVLPIPGSEANEFAMVQVFRRKSLLSVFPTSSAIILDNRNGRKRKRIQDRLFCLLCPGRAGKRILCIHEITAKHYYESNNETNESLQDNEHEEVEGYWKDVLLNEEKADLDKPVEKSATISYSSRYKRNVFSCVSEDKALTRILNTSDYVKDASPGKSDGTNFVGENEMLICFGCGYEARSSPETSFIH